MSMLRSIWIIPAFTSLSLPTPLAMVHDTLSRRWSWPNISHSSHGTPYHTPLPCPYLHQCKSHGFAPRHMHCFFFFFSCRLYRICLLIRRACRPRTNPSSTFLQRVGVFKDHPTA